MRKFAAFACTFACMTFASAAVAKDPQEDKVICKRQQEADTGSHFSTTKKVCLKESEWKELERGSEQFMRQLREHGGSDPNAPRAMGGGPG